MIYDICLSAVVGIIGRLEFPRGEMGLRKERCKPFKGVPRCFEVVLAQASDDAILGCSGNGLWVVDEDRVVDHRAVL